MQTAAHRIIIGGPNVPGDITGGAFFDTGDGTVPGPFTVNYYKVGKLYFGFNVYNATFGQVNMVLGDVNAGIMNACVARICAQLGITEQARYIGNIYSGTPRGAIWNGATWTQNNPNEQQFIIGILST